VRRQNSRSHAFAQMESAQIRQSGPILTLSPHRIAERGAPISESARTGHSRRTLPNRSSAFRGQSGCTRHLPGSAGWRNTRFSRFIFSNRSRCAGVSSTEICASALLTIIMTCGRYSCRSPFNWPRVAVRI